MESLLFVELDPFEGCSQEGRAEVGRSTEQSTLQVIKRYRELSMLDKIY